MLDFVVRPCHPIVLFSASQLNRQQQLIIEHLLMENEVQRKKVGKDRILQNDNQRHWLAVKGKVFGRRVVRELH